MDPAKFQLQKEALLKLIDLWDGSDRGFSDIVRNALDLDPKVAGTFTKQYGVTSIRLREWGRRQNLPGSFRDQDQYVEFIKGYFIAS